MKNIDNTVTPEIPTQPIEIPTPPKSNLFKYLFIVCLFFLLASAIYSFFLIKNLNSKLESTKPDITEVTPADNSTKNWKTYTDKNTGLTFKYPSTVYLYQQDSENQKNDIYDSNIEVTVDKLSEFNGPTSTEPPGDLAPTSKRLNINKFVKLNNKTKAEEFIILQSDLDFDTPCSLFLNRQIFFSTGGYNISIYYSYEPKGSYKSLVPLIPIKYLTINKEDCGDNDKMTWKNQEEFYKDISNNQLENKTLQNWFNDFDKIVSTIVLK